MLPRSPSTHCESAQIRGLHSTGRPFAHVARDLRIRKEDLRNWVRRAEADGGESKDWPATAEADELRQPHREIAELRQENEILKSRQRVLSPKIDRPWTRLSR
ncbi:transposase [Streptacidiphilus carbonis]|uniref:transposase n=1 Tax=Streptacidiphilus carbonis TaxID=105422 RepID=UPI000A02DE99